MKKRSYILIMVIASFFTSCEKFLEVNPANVKAITSLDEIKGILGGYLKSQIDPNDIVKNSPFYRELMFFPNFRIQQLFLYQSDEINSLVYPTLYSAMFHLDNYNYGVRWKYISAQKEIWDNSYLVIGFMNSLLNEMKKMDGTDSEKNFLKAEIKLQRAWHIFKLIQYFATYNNNELGIPLNLDAEKIVDFDASRKPQSELYNILISEVEEVLSYGVTTDEYHVFYSPEFAHALLAKVYWFKALSAAGEDTDWENAREHAIVAMQGRHLATDRVELANLFKGTNRGLEKDNPYVLLKFKWDWVLFENSMYFREFWGYPQYSSAPEMYRGVKITDELFNLYDEGDIRMGLTESDYDKSFVSTSKETVKFFNANYFSNVHEIYIMFRVADLYLMVAESYAREGDNGNAMTWLNEFKESRNANPYFSGDLIEEIMNERKKEFVTEFDMRWLDMKRTGVSYSRQYMNAAGEVEDLTLEPNDYRYAFFIPKDTELSYNKEIQQNPGWNSGDDQ